MLFIKTNKMKTDQLQTIVESKRKHLIDVVSRHNFFPWQLAALAVEEYFTGQPNGKYDYQIARQHFENNVIFNSKNSDRPYNYKQLYTEVLRHLFDVHLSQAYLVIKHFVYIELDKMKKDDTLWNDDYIANFDDWSDGIAHDIFEDIDNNGYCDFNYNYTPLEDILEKSTAKTKKK